MTQNATDRQELYTRIAEMSFEGLRAKAADLATVDKSFIEASAGKFIYPAKISLTVFLFYGTLAVEFYNDDRSQTLATFTGECGGIGAGFGHTWGAAVFDTPIEYQIGLEANFEVHLLVVWTEVNFFTLRNRHYGSADGGGLGLGQGVLGGKGSFSKG